MVQAKARPVSSDSSLARALADLVEGQRAISLWCRALEQATLWEDHRLRKLLGAWLTLAKSGHWQEEDQQNEASLQDDTPVVHHTESSVTARSSAAPADSAEMVSGRPKVQQIPARLQKYGKMPSVQVDTDLRLAQVFDKCDRNGYGQVNKHELIEACANSKDIVDLFSLPQSVHQEGKTRDEFERILESINSVDNQDIDWTEFKAAFADRTAAADQQGQIGQAMMPSVGLASTASVDLNIQAAGKSSETDIEDVGNEGSSQPQASEMPARLQKYSKEKIQVAVPTPPKSLVPPAGLASPQEIAKEAQGPAALPKGLAPPPLAKGNPQQVAEEDQGPLPTPKRPAQPATWRCPQQTTKEHQEPLPTPKRPIQPATLRSPQQTTKETPNNPAQLAAPESQKHMATEDHEPVALPASFAQPATPKGLQQRAREEYESQFEVQKKQINALLAKRLEMNAELQRQAELSEKFAEQLAKEEAARKRAATEKGTEARQRSMELFEVKLQKLQEEAAMKQNHLSNVSQAPKEAHRLMTAGAPDLNMDKILARLEENSRAQIEVAVSPRSLLTPDKLQAAEQPGSMQFPHHQKDDHELPGSASESHRYASGTPHDADDALQMSSLEQRKKNQKFDALQIEVMGGASESHEDAAAAIQSTSLGTDVRRMPLYPLASGSQHGLRVSQDESMANSTHFRSSEFPHKSIAPSVNESTLSTTGTASLSTPSYPKEDAANMTPHATSTQTVDAERNASLTSPELHHGGSPGHLVGAAAALSDALQRRVLKNSGAQQQNGIQDSLSTGAMGNARNSPKDITDVPLNSASAPLTRVNLQGLVRDGCPKHSSGAEFTNTSVAMADASGLPSPIDSLHDRCLRNSETLDKRHMHTPNHENYAPNTLQGGERSTGSHEGPADMTHSTGYFPWPGMDMPSMMESPVSESAKNYQQDKMQKDASSKRPDGLQDVVDTMFIAGYISPTFANEHGTPSKSPEPREANYKRCSLYRHVLGNNSEGPRDRAFVEPRNGTSPPSSIVKSSLLFQTSQAHDQNNTGSFKDGTPLRSLPSTMGILTRARSAKGLPSNPSRHQADTQGATHSEPARDEFEDLEDLVAEQSKLAGNAFQAADFALKHAEVAGNAFKNIEDLAFEDIEDLAWQELQKYLACESGDNGGMKLPDKEHGLPSTTSSTSPHDWETYVERAVRKGLVRGHAVADKLQSLMQVLHDGRQMKKRTDKQHAQGPDYQPELFQFSGAKARASRESRRASENHKLWLNEFVKPFGEGEIVSHVASPGKRHILDSSSDSEAEWPSKLAYPLTQASTDVEDGSDKNTLRDDVPIAGVDYTEHSPNTREDDSRGAYLLRLLALLSRSHDRSVQVYYWNAWRAYCLQIVEVAILPTCAEPRPCRESHGPDAAAEAAAKAEPERHAAEAAARKQVERFAAEAAARAERERLAVQASAEAEHERLAVEAAAKAGQERLTAEAATQAQADRQTVDAASKAAEAAAKVVQERLVAQAVTKAEQERLAVEMAAKADQERMASEAAAKVEADHQTVEAAAKALEAVSKTDREHPATVATAAEQERLAIEAAAKVEADDLATEKAAKADQARFTADAYRLATHAAVKIEVDCQTAEALFNAAKAEQEHLAVEAVVKQGSEHLAAEAFAEAEKDQPTLEAAGKAEQECFSAEAAEKAQVDPQTLEEAVKAAEAAAEAERERFAVEAATEADQERLSVEIAATAEQERMSSEASAKAQADPQLVEEASKAAEAAAETERERFERLAVQMAATVGQARMASKAAAKAEVDSQTDEVAASAAEAATNTQQECFASEAAVKEREHFAAEAAKPEHECLAVEAAAQAQQAAAKAEAQRQTTEVAAKVEEAAAEAAPKAECERLALEAGVKDQECFAAEAAAEAAQECIAVEPAATAEQAVPKAEVDRQIVDSAGEAAAKSERERLAAQDAMKTERQSFAVEAAAKAEQEQLAVETVRHTDNSAAEAAAQAERAHLAMEVVVKAEKQNAVEAAAKAEQERLSVEAAAQARRECLAAEASSTNEADRQTAEATAKAAEAIAKARERFAVEAAPQEERQCCAAEAAAKAERERPAVERTSKTAEAAANVEVEHQKVEAAAEAAEAAARAMRERLAVEAVGKTENERLTVELAVKAELECLAVQAAATALPEHLAAEAAAKLRLALEAAARAEQEHMAVEIAAKAEQNSVVVEAGAKVEADQLAAQASAKVAIAPAWQFDVIPVREDSAFLDEHAALKHARNAMGFSGDPSNNGVGHAGLPQVQCYGATAVEDASNLNKDPVHGDGKEPSSLADETSGATASLGAYRAIREIFLQNKSARSCSDSKEQPSSRSRGDEVHHLPALHISACEDAKPLDENPVQVIVKEASDLSGTFFRSGASDRAEGVVPDLQSHDIPPLEGSSSVDKDSSRNMDGKASGIFSGSSREEAGEAAAAFENRLQSHTTPEDPSPLDGCPDHLTWWQFRGFPEALSRGGAQHNAAEEVPHLGFRYIPAHEGRTSHSARGASGFRRTWSRDGASHREVRAAPPVRPSASPTSLWDRDGSHTDAREALGMPGDAMEGKLQLESHAILSNDCLLPEDSTDAAAIEAFLASRPRSAFLDDAPSTPGCVRYMPALFSGAPALSARLESDQLGPPTSRSKVHVGHSLQEQFLHSRKIEAITCKCAKPYSNASLLTWVLLPWALLVCGRRRSLCLKGFNLGSLVTWLFAWTAFQLWRSNVIQYVGESSANEYMFNIVVLSKHVYMVLQASKLRGYLARCTIHVQRSALKRSARHCRHQWQAGLWQDDIAVLIAPRLLFLRRVAYRAWAAGTSKSEILTRCWSSLPGGRRAFMRSEPRTIIDHLLVSAACLAWRAHITASLTEMRTNLCRQEVRRTWGNIAAAQRRVAIHQESSILYQCFNAWHSSRLAHSSSAFFDIPLDTLRPPDVAHARELHRGRVSTLGHHLQRKASRNMMALAFLVWLSVMTGQISPRSPLLLGRLKSEVSFNGRSLPYPLHFKVWLLTCTLLQWALHSQRKRVAMEHCCERAAWHDLLDRRDLWLSFLGWRARTVDRRRVFRLGQELCNPFHLIGFRMSNAGPSSSSHLARCWDGQRLADLRDALLVGCRGAGPALDYNCYDFVVLRVVLRSWSNECCQVTAMRRKPRRNFGPRCAAGRRVTAAAARRARLVAAWMVWTAVTSSFTSGLELGMVETELRRLWSSLAALQRRLRRHAEMRLLRSCMVQWRRRRRWEN